MARRTALVSFVASSAVAVLFAACGGGTPPADTIDTAVPTTAEPSATSEPEPSSEPAPSAAPSASAASSASASASASAPSSTFDALSHEQKVAFMKDSVIPKMGEIFKAYDGKKYAKINCGTCHGPGAREGKFEMPNASLPKFADFPEAMKKNKKATEWMASTVLPEMAKLLGEAPFDPATKQGFGCFNCHTKP